MSLPPALQAVDDLRRAAVELAASEDAGAQRVGRGLAEYLDRAPIGAELDACIGISTPSGEPWWQIEARRVRNAALRELAARFWPEKPVVGQAQEVARASLRYAASVWRFDRGRADMPESYWDSQKQLLWHAFKSGARMPLATRQLQTILAANGRNTEA